MAYRFVQWIVRTNPPREPSSLGDDGLHADHSTQTRSHSHFGSNLTLLHRVEEVRCSVSTFKDACTACEKDSVRFLILVGRSRAWCSDDELSHAARLKVHQGRRPRSEVAAPTPANLKSELSRNIGSALPPVQRLSTNDLSQRPQSDFGAVQKKTSE